MINVILSFAGRKLYQSDVHLVKNVLTRKILRRERERERDIQLLKRGTREIFSSFYIKIREYRAFRNLVEFKSLLKFQVGIYDVPFNFHVSFYETMHF